MGTFNMQIIHAKQFSKLTSAVIIFTFSYVFNHQLSIIHHQLFEYALSVALSSNQY